LIHPLLDTPSIKQKKQILQWMEDMKILKVSSKTKYELLIVPKAVEYFCKEFIKLVNEMKADYKIIGLDISEALPYPFNKDKVPSYGGYYSYDRKHIYLIFGESSAQDGFFYRHVLGNPCKYLGGGTMDIENLQMELQPIFVDFEMTFPNKEDVYMKYYTVLMPYSILNDKMKNIKQYVRDFVVVHWGKYVYEKNNSKNDYLNYLIDVQQKLEDLIFDESTPELTIDKFLEENPIILEQGLNLLKPMHQVVLKNLLGIYEHDLKPDLIAFDDSQKCWVIVDYKKVKPTIIKNLNRVRTGFRAEVHNLEDQIRDYIEFFDEMEHRQYVQVHYNVDIQYPKGIGIIGYVSPDERKDFNRLMNSKPRWFNVVPYNDLYENFCRYLILVNQLLPKNSDWRYSIE
jgi:hypothetical protein